jgi:hypothetical protein
MSRGFQRSLSGAAPIYPMPLQFQERSNSFSSSGRRRSSLGKLLNLVAPSTEAGLLIEFDSAHNPDHTFKTGDAIAGHVTITAPAPVSFDEIEVALVGQTECVIDRLGILYHV